jgi:hypothetical protein
LIDVFTRRRPIVTTHLIAYSLYLTELNIGYELLLNNNKIGYGLLLGRAGLLVMGSPQTVRGADDLGAIVNKPDDRR